ncbi:MAG: serine/threonine protein kinase, partial [Planctomycetaceae bacterium]|nr:serine/threonine protein kinase [Planctomycetaceae bacterium]
MQTPSAEESGNQKNHSLPEPADQTQVSAPIVKSPPIQRGDSSPAMIGAYPVIRKLGSGGMANVYLAINPADHSEIAIKVHQESVDSNPHLVERFQKELRLLAEINHPHVTNLLEAGEYQQKLYLAMEYVPGIDLKELLNTQKRLSEKAALRIVYDVADALSFAHRKGIVHRDIKPANVLLGDFTNTSNSAADTLNAMISNGQHPVVKLTDFGLARQMDQSESLALTKTGAMLGTPYYLAPEQCMDTAPIQPATDIYSLGITLFELLAGRPPFLAQDSVKLITMHCFDQPPNLKKLNPEVSDAVAALVERCLQKCPEARFADGEHLRDEIGRILAGELTPAPQHPLTPVSETRVMEASWEWDLSCSPEDLWPFVSNTERINHAIGLPPVEYTTGRDEHGAISKTGSFRLGWARL